MGYQLIRRVIFLLLQVLINRRVLRSKRKRMGFWENWGDFLAVGLVKIIKNLSDQFIMFIIKAKTKLNQEKLIIIEN